MDMMRLLVVALMATLAACSRPSAATSQEQNMKETTKPECADCGSTPALEEASLPKTEAEWKKKLTPEQFYVLRQKGTERSESGAYLHHKEDGIYACAEIGRAS